MGFIRYLLEKFGSRKDKGPINFKNSQGILIRPDGSWVVSNGQQNQVSPYAPPKIIANIPPPPKARWWEDNPSITKLSFPPDYFPQAQELFSKLEQCIELDIIESCAHTQTENNVYILSIELPCQKDHAENMRKFKMFIKAMEEAYKFKTVQQERLNSVTSNKQHYLVVFEYDPKMHVLKKLKVDEKNED